MTVITAYRAQRSVSPDLVKLSTPPNGVCLDPFAGSGTTGMACVHEGFDAILIECEAEYVEIARRRVAVVVAQREMEIA